MIFRPFELALGAAAPLAPPLLRACIKSPTWGLFHKSRVRGANHRASSISIFALRLRPTSTPVKSFSKVGHRAQTSL